MELTDLEVCKRIGEIEKLNGDFGTHRGGVYGRRYIDGTFSPYNPIVDDALSCQLRDKYEVEIDYGDSSVSIYGNKSPREFMPIAGVYFTDREQIKRSVCLAIIEANKS